MKIACVQFAPIHKDIEANLHKIDELLRASAPVDLFVLPELSLSGYAFATADEARPFATPESHPAIAKLQILAKELSAAIAIGIIEEAGGHLYNAAYLISRSGDIVLRYRKVHLFYYEKIVFAPGDLGFPVAEITTSTGETAKVGMQICYDWRFPEATRSLALAGAEIVAMPSNIVTTTGMLLATLQIRAFENKVIVAFADRIGTEILRKDDPEQLIFRGESCIINFNGEIFHKATTEEITISYEIHPKDTSRKSFNKFNDIIADRRPDQYR
jgi:predicted amidohydrolase